MSERSCGKCSLCCKLSYVSAFNKAIDTWCEYCRPGKGGCSIYDSRPSVCHSFLCAWLANEKEFGDEWFPARAKMYITPLKPGRSIRQGGMMVTVDPSYPNTWRHEPYYSQLLRWAAKGIVVELRIGLRFVRINQDGSEKQMTATQAWIEARYEPS